MADSEPVPVLDGLGAAQLVDSLLRESGLVDASDRFEPVDTWMRPRSGSIFHHVVGRPSGIDVVAKVVPRWEPGEAERVFHSMIELDDLIAGAGIENAHGIRPLASSDHPPIVVMPYIASTDLVSILRSPEHGAWSGGDLDAWMERAGAMLAAYHRQPVGDIDPAAEEVRHVASRMKLRADDVERLLTAADWRTKSRRRYGDFGPGNFQGAEDGRLYLLDPPEEADISVIHRDLSNFLFETRRQLAGRGFTRSRPVKGEYPALRDRFLEGYRAFSPGMVWGPADEALVALFEVKRAMAMARKRFPGRLGDSLWFGKLANGRRLDLRRRIREMR